MGRFIDVWYDTICTGNQEGRGAFLYRRIRNHIKHTLDRTYSSEYRPLRNKHTAYPQFPSLVAMGCFVDVFSGY